MCDVGDEVEQAVFDARKITHVFGRKRVSFSESIAAISGGRYSPPMTATIIKDIHVLANESLTEIKVPSPCVFPPRACCRNHFSVFNRLPIDSIALISYMELSVRPCLATNI
jgi:hypothetical protein